MKRYFLPLFILAVILFVSCYYDNVEALYPSLNSSCDTTNVTYSGTLVPILNNNCTGCHGTSSPSGSISLTSYTNFQTVAASGLLINALKGNGVSIMPPSGALSTCRINQFQVWITKGMLNN